MMTQAPEGPPGATWRDVWPMFKAPVRWGAIGGIVLSALLFAVAPARSEAEPHLYWYMLGPFIGLLPIALQLRARPEWVSLLTEYLAELTSAVAQLPSGSTEEKRQLASLVQLAQVIRELRYAVLLEERVIAHLVFSGTVLAALSLALFTHGPSSCLWLAWSLYFTLVFSATVCAALVLYNPFLAAQICEVHEDLLLRKAHRRQPQRGG